MLATPYESVRIVHEDLDYLLVDKPAGLACAPAPIKDGEGAPSLCTWVFERYPELAAVAGHHRLEGGLAHRLDTATSGLVLFARNDAAFAYLAAVSAADRFRKEYRLLSTAGGWGLEGSRPLLASPSGLAEADWFRALRQADYPALARGLSSGLPMGQIQSLFRPFGPGRRRVACAHPAAQLPAAKDWGRQAYQTTVLSAAPVMLDGQDLLEARVAITRGFRHQIRAHFAWLGLPLRGDEVYNEDSSGSLALRACRISFPLAGGGDFDYSLEAEG